MSNAYTVGRGSAADIKVPKQHDAVGKLHLEIQDAGSSRVRITDLQSTNGTFVRVGKTWEEVKGARIVSMDAELMLGDFKTTPRKFLEMAPVPVKDNKSRRRSGPAEPPPLPPPIPGKKRSGPRRNEFGEIVIE